MTDTMADASGISLTQYLESFPEIVAAAEDVGDTFAPPAPLEYCGLIPQASAALGVRRLRAGPRAASEGVRTPGPRGAPPPPARYAVMPVCKSKGVYPCTRSTSRPRAAC